MVLIAGIGTLQKLPDRLLIYELLLYCFLALQVAIGVWRVMPRRTRIFLALFLCAVHLHLVAVLAGVYGLDGASGYTGLAARLGEALALVTAAASPFLLLDRRSPLLLASVVGAISVAFATALGWADWSLAALIASGGFGVELPVGRGGVVVYAVALGLYFAATAALVARPGPSRLRGFGLALIGLSGYQLQLPFQLVSSLLGLLCLVEAALHEEAAAVAADGFHEAVRRIAAWAGARELMTAGARGEEEVRGLAHFREQAVELSIRRRAGRIAVLELVTGFAPRAEAPPLSLRGKGLDPDGPRAGSAVATGDAVFDEAFHVEATHPLVPSQGPLGDELRMRLYRHREAFIAVWPGRGARLRLVGEGLLRAVSISGDAGEETVLELLELVVDLSRPRANAEAVAAPVSFTSDEV
jgi:hypothetical protein